jgi:hypothetical protein
MTSNKLRQIDQQRLASHIKDWTEEIERLTKEIHNLIPLINNLEADDDNTYRRLRGLQAARQIMIDQVREMGRFCANDVQQQHLIFSIS